MATCYAQDCGKVADYAISASGENGSFKGDLCEEHERQLSVILRPNILNVALLHPVSIEELNTALRAQA